MATPLSARKAERSATAARISAARRRIDERSALTPLSGRRPLLLTSLSGRESSRRTESVNTTPYRKTVNKSRAQTAPRGSSLQVDKIPADVEAVEYVIDAKNIVSFSGRTHFLSNLFESPITVGDVKYASVEHYYQSTKVGALCGEGARVEILKESIAPKAKTLAKQLLANKGIGDDKVNEWKQSVALDLLHHAVVKKFVQNWELGERLIRTNDALLVHTYEYDSFFATGCDHNKLLQWAKALDGKAIKVPAHFSDKTTRYIPLVGNGKNILGFLLMKVRAHILGMIKTMCGEDGES